MGNPKYHKTFYYSHIIINTQPLLRILQYREHSDKNDIFISLKGWVLLCFTVCSRIY
jgi:hypothetical protein